MKVMKINTFLIPLLAGCLMLCAQSCKDDESSSASGNEGFFIEQTAAYNLTSSPEIVIPVVRLGQSGDLTVNVASTGSSQFTVPSSVVIKDGDRVADLVVTFDIKSLTYNEVYNLEVSISDFSSIYGYQKTDVTIEYPTSYEEYGSGIIYENWWGEQEDKTLYVRDFATDVYQCYLPDCWGHDSGEGYPVQDYVFYWNTKTNKLYVPYQYMGSGVTYIADYGSFACKFGGPDYAEGKSDWFSYIDNNYSTSGKTQPHYDSDAKTFYLSDGYVENGAINGGAQDRLELE